MKRQIVRWRRVWPLGIRPQGYRGEAHRTSSGPYPPEQGKVGTDPGQGNPASEGAPYGVPALARQASRLATESPSNLNM